MKYEKYLKIATGIIILAILLLKAQALFTHSEFSDSESYRHLYKIESFFEEEEFSHKLIYQESSFEEFTAYYFIYGTFYKIIPSINTIKTLEILQVALVLILIYYLTKDITENRFAAIFSIAIFVSTPLLFSFNPNSLSPDLFVINLFLVASYILIKSSILFEQKEDESYIKRIFKKINLGVAKKHFRNQYIFIIVIILIILATMPGHSLIFASTLFVYLIGLTIFNVSSKKYFRELTTFSAVLITGSFFIFHKSRLLALGVKSFTNNVPAQLFQSNNSQFSLFNLFIYLGALTILAAIYGSYFYLNNMKLKESKKVLFFSSAFAVGVLAYLLKLGHIKIITLYLGVTASILIATYASRGIKNAIQNYFVQIKEIVYWTVLCTIVMVGALSLNYSFASTLPQNNLYQDQIQSFKLISADKPDLVVVPQKIADAAIYFTNGTVIINEEYYKSNNPEKALFEINQIYTNINSIKVQEALNSYGDEYDSVFIYFDTTVSNEYNIDSPGFDYDNNCFERKQLTNTTEVYEYEC